jgi:hypothetical protein
VSVTVVAGKSATLIVLAPVSTDTTVVPAVKGPPATKVCPGFT